MQIDKTKIGRLRRASRSTESFFSSYICDVLLLLRFCEIKGRRRRWIALGLDEIALWISSVLYIFENIRARIRFCETQSRDKIRGYGVVKSAFKLYR